jgi:glycosyltransferase involved in cell wall biosynthesis
MNRSDKEKWGSQTGAEVSGSFPLVSLVITSYNRAHLIEKAIKSALAQDYPNLEIIISDNCSTDNTDEAIRTYLADPRIKYSVNETNIGMIPNFDKATRDLASGKYITYVSSDDYLVNPSFVSESVDIISKLPNVLLVTGINVCEFTSTGKFEIDYSYIYYKDTFYKRPFVNGKEVFLSYPRCHSISFGGTLLDRQKLVEVKAFEGKVLSGDAQVILKLLLVGDAAFIDKQTYVAKRHGGNATATVTEAETYINNLAYIEAPYQAALKSRVFDQATLDGWREGMYVDFLSKCLRHFYDTDRKQFALLSDYVRSNFPRVHRRITGTPQWRFFTAVHANPSVAALYREGRAMLSKAKTLVTGRRVKIAHQ